MSSCKDDDGELKTAEKLTISTNEEQQTPLKEEELLFPKNICYTCGGKGHWARECTSLPMEYRTQDCPVCYSCGGQGHYARVCPTGFLKKVRKHFTRRWSNATPAEFYSYGYNWPTDSGGYFAPGYLDLNTTYNNNERQNGGL